MHERTRVGRNERPAHVIGLDDADVVAVQVATEAVELLELARHAAVARDQAVPQQVLVHARIGEVAAQRLVVQRVVAQRRRVRVQVRVGQVEVEVLLGSPHLSRTRTRDSRVQNFHFETGYQL